MPVPLSLVQCREGGVTIALCSVAQREQSLMMHAGKAVMLGPCAHHMWRRFSFAPCKGSSCFVPKCSILLFSGDPSRIARLRVTREYCVQPTEFFCPLLDSRVWNTVKTEFLYMYSWVSLGGNAF